MSIALAALLALSAATPTAPSAPASPPPVDNAADVQVHREEAAPALTVRFRGRDRALPPANPTEWKSDPWTRTERDGKLIGRGVGDNKYGLLTLTRAFLRLKREGHVPARDLVLVFTGDEETTMATTRRLAERYKGAAFAVNADAGGGFVPSDGPPQYMLHYRFIKALDALERPVEAAAR